MTCMAPPLDIREGGEVLDAFREFGVMAFTTGRAAGSFGTQTDEPVRAVMSRWSSLRDIVGGNNSRLATAAQVHGNEIVVHQPGWRGWLRGPNADGHISKEQGTALAVTVADCVPVFIAHPSGAVAALHSGWRGTVARISERAIEILKTNGLEPADLRLHCGPAICGKCYEVSPDVYQQLTGKTVSTPITVDLRALIADHARAAGVKQISISPLCTKCDNHRFFSHRAGDSGRQLGVIFRPT
jgi:YfiH family protein